MECLNWKYSKAADTQAGRGGGARGMVGGPGIANAWGTGEEEYVIEGHRGGEWKEVPRLIWGVRSDGQYHTRTSGAEMRDARCALARDRLVETCPAEAHRARRGQRK